MVFASKLNRREDSGHPCLRPHFILNLDPRDPFIRTDTVAQWNTLANVLDPSITKVRPIRTNHKKFQSTRSKAFSKSNLKISSPIFFVRNVHHFKSCNSMIIDIAPMTKYCVEMANKLNYMCIIFIRFKI